MAKTPKPRFVTIGKSGKMVHVVHTELYDRKHSKCQTVRKAVVAGKVPSGSLSAEAASVLPPCSHCHTDDVVADTIEKSKTPDQRRQEANERRDEVLDRAKVQTKKSKSKKSKEPRAKKETKPKATKAGHRSMASGTGDPTREKAEALAAFGKEHGWAPNVTDADPGVVMEAIRGEEVVRCYFVDGKYDTSRHASVNVGSWSGKLRGVHGCRNQMGLEGRDRPHPQPGQGRSRSSGKKSKKEEPGDVVPDDESPDDARKRVPFLIDDEELEIIDTIKGKTIRWRNGVTNGVMEATVPSQSKRTTIIDHPKTGRRILSFLEVVEAGSEGEVLGPERSVALDKIIRVVG